MGQVPRVLSSNINFRQESILDFEIVRDHYQGVLLARLIQYLKPEQVADVFQKLSAGISNGGVLALSYKRSLGSGKINSIFPLNNVDHDIGHIKTLLDQNSFQILDLREDVARDESIRGSLPGHVYEILSQKA
jgi:hypothetical protein